MSLNEMYVWVRVWVWESERTIDEIRRDDEASNGIGNSIADDAAIGQLLGEAARVLLKRFNVRADRPQVSFEHLKDRLYV